MQTTVAYFKTLSQSQADKLIHIDPKLIALAELQDPINLANVINQLVQMNCSEKMSSGATPEYEKLWFPILDTCSNPESLHPLQRDIFDQKNIYRHLTLNHNHKGR